MMRSALTLFLALFLVANSAHSQIPASERAVLQNLYVSTNGAGWSGGYWNGPIGSECFWLGVTCASGHVTGLKLNYHHLTGTLPSITGLTNLANFDVSVNQLTGSIPSLTGLTNLANFDASFNQLTGPIPALTGLTNLQDFDVNNNQLTGSIPSLAGLTSLYSFWAYSNQLTGSIPSLTGLTNLWSFDVDSNQLTGSIPSLTGLTNLRIFSVSANQLTGAVPAVPSPMQLGNSTLCPNFLNHTTDTNWNLATGETPWYGTCPASPPPQAR